MSASPKTEADLKMPESQSNSRKWLWLTLLATTLVVLIVQVPILADANYGDEDLRYIYWLHRLRDPSLFQNDPVLGYQIGEVNLGFTTLLFNKVHLLYGALYALLSPFFTPFTFSELLIFPLALLSSYYLFRIVERLADSFSAFLLCLIFTLIIVIPYSGISLSSGLPRAFSLPLLLAMLHYMMKDDLLGMAVVLVLGSFNAPIFLTILLTYGVKYSLESIQRRRIALTGKEFGILFAALLVTISLLLPALFTGLNTVPTDANGSQEATVFSSPLFGVDGRYPLFNATLSGNGGVFDFGVIGLYSMLLLLGLIPIALVLGRKFRNLPRSFWYLALGSLIGFIASWLVVLFTPSASLHLPSRYLQTTVFIVSFVLFGINAPLAIQVSTRYLSQNRGVVDWLLIITGLACLVIILLSGASTIVAAVVGLLVVVVMVLVLTIRRRSRSVSRGENAPPGQGGSTVASAPVSLRRQEILVVVLLGLPLLLFVQLPTRLYRPAPESAELLSFVKTLTKEALISGYPCALDDIPLYAQRAVMFSCEVESRDMAMMLASLDAYFAESEEQVLEYCKQYGVDYMVTSPWTFSEDYRSQERMIYEPFDSYLRQHLDGRNDFALDRIPDSAKVFQNDSHFVFPCTAEAFISDE